MGSTTPTDVPLGSRLISIEDLRQSCESNYSGFRNWDEPSRPALYIVMNDDEPLSNIWQKIEGYWPECLLLKNCINNE